MQAQAVLEKECTGEWTDIVVKENLFEKPVGLLSRIFGCKHKDMTRPFSNGRENYRVCTNCGAHRRFDTKTFKTYGPFYFNTQAKK
jgi:hypothetical protein